MIPDNKQTLLTLVLVLLPCAQSFLASTPANRKSSHQRKWRCPTHLESAVMPTSTNAYSYRAPATATTKKNPRYPDYPLDKYMSNPYFQLINAAYPGLQLIQEEPFIFIINDFLTPEECRRLRAKADEGTLRPQIGGGSVLRTSSGVVCTPEEVPSIQDKMMALTGVQDRNQLQYLKVSKYQPGQTFSKHTDAWPTEGAPISRGWVHEEDFFGDERRRFVGCLPALEQPNHNTLLTCFVYLNDVEQGGCTCFPNIGIHTGRYGSNFYTHPSPMDSRQRPDGSAWDWNYRNNPEPLRVAPQEGMAVLHFCSLLPEYGGITDGNTFHIAEPPAEGQDKYISQQFVSSCTSWMLPEDSMPLGRVSWDTI
ncbi:prolyl 4-hydroxylase [Seminavis robusta]|uniref:Prolyl 4-hydroxylase n=1 Tax=Seminavis robusta TaxID=568900 RepID=A0A9N8E338_9STRA|nr:prolyl 4-hydroxylase [Seminavis robusta]|eukprot:Sro477_g150830.1 prolyl 4-hydroxylase (366) ;mRNA; r:43880-44977